MAPGGPGQAGRAGRARAPGSRLAAPGGWGDAGRAVRGGGRARAGGAPAAAREPLTAGAPRRSLKPARASQFGAYDRASPRKRAATPSGPGRTRSLRRPPAPLQRAGATERSARALQPALWRGSLSRRAHRQGPPSGPAPRTPRPRAPPTQPTQPTHGRHGARRRGAGARGAARPRAGRGRRRRRRARPRARARHAAPGRAAPALAPRREPGLVQGAHGAQQQADPG
jgi:hypothetical protein